jgi:hypothetical protein
MERHRTELLSLEPASDLRATGGSTTTSLTLFRRRVPEVHGWLLERATLIVDAHA